MKEKRFWTLVTALLLALTLLPLPVIAQSGGLADSNALAYERALQMLITSSLTDGGKLEDILTQLIQAGSYQFGLEYLTFVEALVVLQGEDETGLDDALDIIRRLGKNKEFISDYYSYLNKSAKTILPNLEALEQYVLGRKLEAYEDLEAAIAIYDAFPVLDAVTRAGKLTSSLKKEKYDQAMGLLLEGSLSSVLQAKELFEEQVDYRDSAQRLKECLKRISELATPAPFASPTPIPTAKPTIVPTAKPNVKPTETVTLKPAPIPTPIGEMTRYPITAINRGDNRAQTYCGPGSNYRGAGAFKTNKLTKTKGIIIEGDFILAEIDYSGVGKRWVYFKLSAFTGESTSAVPRRRLSGINSVTISDTHLRFGPGFEYDNFDGEYIPGGTQVIVFFEENGWLYAEFMTSEGRTRGWIFSSDVDPSWI